MPNGPKKIRVKLNKVSEKENQCRIDPDPVNKMICKRNYDEDGYMEVYLTSFIDNLITQKELIIKE
jgi:hypothetical protein